MVKLCVNLGIFLFVFIYSSPLNARCNRTSFRKQCKIATQIFVARVLSIEKQTSDIANQEIQTVKVLRLHTWKGTVNDTITFTEILSRIPCFRSRWKFNETFVIYARNNVTDFCPYRTETLEDNLDVKKLNFKYFKNRYRYII